MIASDLDRTVASAEDCFERGEYGTAMALYRAILLSRLAEGAGEATAFDAALIERVADLATLFGHYGAAEDLLVGLAGRFRQSGNSLGVDYALLKLCSLRFAQEHLSGARRALEELSFISGPLESIDPFALLRSDQWERTVAPTASAADQTMLCSRFYLEFSRLLTAHGFYTQAHAIAERGLDLAKGSSSPVVQHAIPPLTLAAAAAALERGDLATPKRLMTAAGQGDPSWQHPAWSVRRLEILAKTQLLSGDLGAAHSTLQDVLARTVRGGFDAAAAHAAINLAQTLILINQTKGAAELLATATGLAEAARDGVAASRAAHLLRVARLRATSLADAVTIAPSVSDLWLEGRVDAASVPADTSAPEMPPSTDFLTLFEDRALVFQWHLGRRDWPGARAHLDELAATFAHTDSMLITARLLVMEGMLAYYTGRYADAYADLSESVEVFETLGLVADEWQALRFLGWVLKRLGRVAEAERVVAQADQTLDVLTGSLAQDHRAIFRLNKWTADEEFLGGELSSLVELAVSNRSASWWRRPWLRWRLRKTVAGFLGHIDRHQRLTFGRTIDAGVPAKSDEWRARAVALGTPRDTAVIGVLILPDRVFIGRLYRGRADVFVRPLTRLVLRGLVSDWHSALAAGEPSGVCELKLSDLSAALGVVGLIDDLPAGVRHLTIVADDSLRGVPFGAFTSHGRRVVERCSVTTAFAWSAGAPRVRRAASGLAVGLERTSADLAPLRHAREEVAMVDGWLAQRHMPVTRLENEAATRESVLARLPGTTHLHVAAHGIFRRDRPDQSGLVMSGGADDDMLTLRDLAALDLSGLQLAVLSACWAADNFVLPGRVVLSLPYSLWRAGVQTVLAPLWEIDDAVAVSFVKRFYDLLESLSPREALQHVQRECIERRLPGCASRDTADPMYWAGFQLFGNGTVAVA